MGTGVGMGTAMVVKGVMGGIEDWKSNEVIEFENEKLAKCQNVK